MVAVTLAVPEPTAVTVPPESTVQTALLDVDQETLPGAGLTVIWKDSPLLKSVASTWLRA